MSIQKKSLISTLKTAKKANVAAGTPSEAVTGSQNVSAKSGVKTIAPKATFVNSSKSTFTKKISSKSTFTKKI